MTKTCEKNIVQNIMMRKYFWEKKDLDKTCKNNMFMKLWGEKQNVTTKNKLKKFFTQKMCGKKICDVKIF